MHTSSSLKLDLTLILDSIRYILGSSGGSWATVVFTYYQKDNITDDEMLGKVILPGDIVYQDLQYMSEGCVRSYTSTPYFLSGLAFSDWMDAVQAIYFTPAGITRGTPYSYDPKTVADIKSRNPSLINTTFLLIRGTGSGMPCSTLICSVLICIVLFYSIILYYILM